MAKIVVNSAEKKVNVVKNRLPDDINAEVRKAIRLIADGKSILDSAQENTRMSNKEVSEYNDALDKLHHVLGSLRSIVHLI